MHTAIHSHVCTQTQFLPLAVLRARARSHMYIFFYSNIARDVITGLLIFVDVYHFNYTFSHAHIERHTHKHICMISAQEGF